MLIIGIDWARSKHDLVFMDENGKILKHLIIFHCYEEFEKLADEIAEFEPDASMVRVGIEHHEGALLHWLLAQGYTVYLINPKSSQRARERFRPSGSKDDLIDAFSIADMVRTDPGRLRPFNAGDEHVDEIRHWVELRIDLVRERTKSIQKLKGILAEWCPDYAKVLDGFGCIWHRELLKKFPLQYDFSHASKKTIQGFLKGRRLCADTRRNVLHAWKQVPISIPSSRLEALRKRVSFLVDSICRISDEIDEIERELKELVRAHPDFEIFNSLPIKGIVSMAALMVIVSGNRESEPEFEELCAFTGVAPITIRSGKSLKVRRRRACNHKLHSALIFFAFASLKIKNCWARDYYTSKRVGGMRHYVALRCLAKRWLKIIRRIWLDRVPYDEQLHRMNRARSLKLTA